MEITTKELLESYKFGERNFGGVFCTIDWFKASEPLINLNLRSINLSGADLSNSRLEGANLKGATLREIQLAESNLRGANMESADLSGASLCKTKFAGANLSGAILRGAFIEETEFSNANLSYVDLRGAVGIEIAYLDGAIFRDTIMPDGSIANDTAYFLLLKYIVISEETRTTRISQYFLTIYLLPNSCNY